MGILKVNDRFFPSPKNKRALKDIVQVLKQQDDRFYRQMVTCKITLLGKYFIDCSENHCGNSDGRHNRRCNNCLLTNHWNCIVNVNDLITHIKHIAGHYNSLYEE